MSDSEYDSEDDDDYVPDESDEEGISLEEDEEKSEWKKNKKEKTLKRKRKGGIKLEEVEDVEEESDDEKVDLCDDLEEPEEKHIKELPKSRQDELWAAFKRDIASVARPVTTKTLSNKKESKPHDVEDLKNKSEIIEQASIIPKTVPQKIEITEIYDFAGEEVKIVKSVDALSHKPSPKTNMQERKESTSNSKPSSVVPLKRASGGLGSVLGKIGKKPKLSTLEKSKLDWHQFKKQEGIEDDLKTSNKDGYLEKQAFLNRVDHKQFEIERDIRQSGRKK